MNFQISLCSSKTILYKLINNTCIGTYTWKGKTKRNKNKPFFKKISAFEIVKILRK